MKAIENRYDFVYLFDVTNGNPNGDPDAGNLPRLDPETNQGLVSDVCLKRKVRNFVAMTKGDIPGHEIFVTERAILERQQRRAWDAIVPDASDKDREKLPRDEQKARELIQWMCANFYDVRTFGAVMSTKGANCGQVRGPVQFAFARSVEPVLPLEISITRMAATTAADAERKGDIRTMGRKHIVPYGLYRAHGYVSASLAGGGGHGTGFSEEDVELLWSALELMFDHDRSAAGWSCWKSPPHGGTDRTRQPGVADADGRSGGCANEGVGLLGSHQAGNATEQSHAKRRRYAVGRYLS